jgi:hypothetical protein
MIKRTQGRHFSPSHSSSDENSAIPFSRRRYIQVPPELVVTMDRERDAFRHRFGRTPTENDPVFFDRESDVPKPMSGHALRDHLLKLFTETRIPVGRIYAHHRIARQLGRGKYDQKLWNSAVGQMYSLLGQR